MGQRALVLVFALALSGISRSASADSITLMWDLSSDPDVIGYVVYVGTQSGVYTGRFDVGNATSFVLPDAVPGILYYFRASSYAAGDTEGPQTAEISGYSDAPPVLTNPGDQTTLVGQQVALQLVGSDPYGQAVSYKATGLPAGLTLTQSTGLITGASSSAGTYSVTASVTDGVLSNSKSFTWAITTTTNAPPTLKNPGSQTSTVGKAASLQLVGADPEGKTVSYKATGLPAGLTLNATTGLISGTPTTGGVYSVTATVSDGMLNASVSFGWTTTTSTNLPPTLKNPGSQTSQVGKSASLLLIGADPEGKALSYKATGLPAGLALNATTGLISGTPTTAAVYSVTATVSDGALTTSVSFSWSIVTTLDTKPPVIAVKNVKAGSTIKLTGTSIALTGTATDDNGVRMVWWYSDRGGLALASGTSSWSATVPLQKGKNVITISATDAAENLGTFRFTVDAQ